MEKDDVLQLEESLEHVNLSFSKEYLSQEPVQKVSKIWINTQLDV